MSNVEKEHKSKKIIIRNILIILVLIFILLYLYARYISTKGLIIKEYPIKTSEIDDAYNGFKIVHFSDLHYGSTVYINEVKNMVNLINKQHPDVIVFTGDLVEKKVILSEKEQKELIKELKKLDANIKIYAVKGNHDYDHEYFDLITSKLPWKVLDNTYDYLYYNSDEPIVFVGLDDLLRGKEEYDNAFSYLKEDTNPHYTIVLAHEPDQIDKFIDYDVDLVLSGHSHLGQVRIPLIGAIYTPKGSKKYYDEHYIVNNTNLYINGGIGTSLIKVRFFNKPSINLYRFFKN